MMKKITYQLKDNIVEKRSERVEHLDLKELMRDLEDIRYRKEKIKKESVELQESFNTLKEEEATLEGLIKELGEDLDSDDIIIVE